MAKDKEEAVEKKEQEQAIAKKKDEKIVSVKESESLQKQGWTVSKMIRVDGARMHVMVEPK